MDGGAGQNDPNTWRAGIDLSHCFRLFVGRPAHHEDDNILGFVPRVATALEEWVLQLPELAFDEVL